MEEELVKADVLCVGGGIAGLMAAIRASELGAKVIIAEKGNALHSGRGRFGNDHFETYVPEVHDMDMETWNACARKNSKLSRSLANVPGPRIASCVASIPSTLT